MLNKIKFQRSFFKHTDFIFVSPHFDDAVLSCGQLLLNLKRLGKNITVITVFTRGGARNTTPQSISFLKSCGYGSAAKLYKVFRSEDIRAAKYLKAKHIHLNFIDAAWRAEDKYTPIYKNEISQFSGNISPLDANIVKKVGTELKNIIPKDKQLVVFGPLGIGGHADHVVVRKLLEDIPNSKIFWEDFPYNINRKSLKSFLRLNKEFRYFYKLPRQNDAEKDRVIKFYNSQLKSLFPSGKIPQIDENYYFMSG